MRSLVTLLICGSVALPAAQFAYGQAARTAARGQGAAKPAASRAAVSVSGNRAVRTMNAAQGTSVFNVVPRSSTQVGSVNPAVVAGGTNTVSAQSAEGLSGTSGVIDVSAGQTLTAAQAAELQAELASDPVIVKMNDAHADMLATINDFNPEAEDALGNFVQSVTQWTCGNACVESVTNVLVSGTAYAEVEVAKGESVSVKEAFTAGLDNYGLTSRVRAKCQEDLGSVLAI